MAIEQCYSRRRFNKVLACVEGGQSDDLIRQALKADGVGPKEAEHYLTLAHMKRDDSYETRLGDLLTTESKQWRSWDKRKNGTWRDALRALFRRD